MAAAAAPAAPSESFLGFGPGSRDPAAPRRRINRGPRHRKKGWRCWAGPEVQLGREVDEFLQDVAMQQRAVGGLIAEQPDKDLFFLDTGKAKQDLAPKRGQEKPLHVDLLLQPDSRVPPPKQPLPRRDPRKQLAKRRRKIEGKKGDLGPKKVLRKENPEEKGRSDPKRGFYDLWEGSAPQDLDPEEPAWWFLQQTKRALVKRPARLREKPSQVPAVEVAAPGASYNPAFEDHQALLLQAHEEELRKKREEDKVERRLKIPEGTDLPTQESQFREQCEGLLEDSGDDDDDDNRDPETPAEPPGGTPTPPPQPPKKTEQQRRRQKEERAQALRRQQEKLQRCRRQELFRLRGLRRLLRLRDRELRQRRLRRDFRRQQRDAAPRRLGRLRFQPPPVEVQLSQELPDTLRALKPEGSVLLDRFKSLQKRNLIEPRERAKFKRRYRLKYVEKRSFRQITL